MMSFKGMGFLKKKMKHKKQDAMYALKLEIMRKESAISGSMAPTRGKEERATDHYRIVKAIGSGAAGQVFMVKHKVTHAKYAMKVIMKEKMDMSWQEMLNEVALLKELDHPHICRLIETFEEPTRLILMLELCTGGELFDQLANLKEHHFDEVTAAKIVHQMLLAIVYIHSKGITHRDLKLENFVFASRKGWDLKLIDFGLSAKVRSEIQVVEVADDDDDDDDKGEGRGDSAAAPTDKKKKKKNIVHGATKKVSRMFGSMGFNKLQANQKKADKDRDCGDGRKGSKGTHTEEKLVQVDPGMTEFVGTSYYMAPEVIEQVFAKEGSRAVYGDKCDTWSIGIITHMLLTGAAPFDREGTSDYEKIRAEIKKGVNFKGMGIHKDAQAFIKACLTEDPAERLSSVDLVTHPWILKFDGEVHSGARHVPRIEALEHVEAMHRFTGFSRMKRMTLMLLAPALKSIIKSAEKLSNYFTELDHEQTGRITMDELGKSLEQLGIHIKHADDPDPHAVDIKQLFDCMDEDHTGRVRYTEYLAAMTAFDGESERLPEELILDAFTRMDIDKDGVVSVADLTTILPGWKVEEIKIMVQEVDSNGDGSVTKDELLNAMKDPGHGMEGHEDIHQMWQAAP